jgi:hypothetical protein
VLQGEDEKIQILFPLIESSKVCKVAVQRQADLLIERDHERGLGPVAFSPNKRLPLVP